MARLVELLFEESPEEIKQKLSKNTSFKIVSCEHHIVNGKDGCKLIFIDPKNSKFLIDKEKEKYWMPVDLYVGGAEHATRHLLYARFWHKFLYDIGAVSTNEPFKKLVHVGLINAEDGKKMSKRWNNFGNPDEIIEKFGADSMRLYEMFMGPFIQNIAWSTAGVKGTSGFLEKIWKLASNVQVSKIPSAKSEKNKLDILFNKTIKKVGEDIENFRFNTAISALMILVNEMEKEEVAKDKFEILTLLISPFALNSILRTLAG